MVRTTFKLQPLSPQPCNKGCARPRGAEAMGTQNSQRTTATAWRESGCALVDIVDFMLAAVEASMGILRVSESASEFVLSVKLVVCHVLRR